MEQFPCMMLVLEVSLLLTVFILPSCSLGCLFISAFLNHFAGYLEIAQLLLSSANDPVRVNRMLETIDMEGDTVSIS